MIPMPPFRACKQPSEHQRKKQQEEEEEEEEERRTMAMAIWVSVTVSMLEETMGLLRVMLRVRRVLTEMRRREVTEERLGTRRTSSKVMPERKLTAMVFVGLVEEVLLLVVVATLLLVRKRTGTKQFDDFLHFYCCALGTFRFCLHPLICLRSR